MLLYIHVHTYIPTFNPSMPSGLSHSGGSAKGTTESLANLLPSANPSLTPVTVGVYNSKGLPPAPLLLQEFWAVSKEEDATMRVEARIRQSREVTDMASVLWYVRQCPHTAAPQTQTRVDGLYDHYYPSKPGLYGSGLGTL